MEIGVIVDGPGDLLSLKAKYPGKFRILKTDGPRGHQAKPAEIIGKAKKQIYMLKALRCKKVILMLDFETRSCSYNEFLKELLEESNKQPIGIEILFVIPNQMIENWYLADIEILSRNKVFIKDDLKQKNYEGKHGKDELKRLFKREYTYNETIHGPQLFCEIREQVAQNNSSSFKTFIEMINSN